jgi:hypothetical protein
MNPITYSLQQLRYQIPKEILEKVFLSNLNYRTIQATTLDTRIRQEVIESRVLVDCNLAGGTETHIPLSDLPKEFIDPFTAIYRIPKTMTQGRTITRALSVSFGEGAIMGASNIAPTQGNALLDAAAGVLNSALPIPIVSTAQVQLIGENTVMIADNMALPVNIFLRCWLENDENFNHIQPTSYKNFAKLVELATKAYIYINAQIPMDKAFIHAGSELGRFKDIIDGYADANEQYDTHYNEVWRKTAYLNDYNAHRRHCQRVLGGNW